MTRAQRRFHRRAWLALALAFPLLCALSLALRARQVMALSSRSTTRGAVP
jgi:hypothetical protein